MFSAAPAVLGFVVGLRHALDADHVAAVGAIVARERRISGAALIGAAWGLGHAVSLLVVGGVIVGCGFVVPPDVGLALEFGVGVMLLGLGVWNFVSRSHEQGPTIPVHAHRAVLPPIRRVLCPLVVGGVHGLAGSAAAVLMVVAAGGGVSLGLVYLLVFGIGTMFGMVALTTALALPMGRACHGSGRAEWWLRIASGALSVAVGALVVHEIACGDGASIQ